jgi:hypothetical protein
MLFIRNIALKNTSIHIIVKAFFVCGENAASFMERNGKPFCFCQEVNIVPGYSALSNQ